MEGRDLKTLPRQHGGLLDFWESCLDLDRENCKNKCQIQLNNRC